METFIFIMFFTSTAMGVTHFIFDNVDKATFYIAVAILIRVGM